MGYPEPPFNYVTGPKEQDGRRARATFNIFVSSQNDRMLILSQWLQEHQGPTLPDLRSGSFLDLEEWYVSNVLCESPRALSPPWPWISQDIAIVIGEAVHARGGGSWQLRKGGPNVLELHKPVFTGGNRSNRYEMGFFRLVYDLGLSVAAVYDPNFDYGLVNVKGTQIDLNEIKRQTARTTPPSRKADGTFDHWIAKTLEWNQMYG